MNFCAAARSLPWQTWGQSGLALIFLRSTSQFQFVPFFSALLKICCRFVCRKYSCKSCSSSYDTLNLANFPFPHQKSHMSGCFLLSLLVFCCIWVYRVVFSCVWMFPIVFGCLSLSSFVFCCIWLYSPWSQVPACV